MSELTDAEHIAQLYSAVYDVARQIPRGRVATYGQVAELAGLPGAARLVGRAMKLVTRRHTVPWQRVVGRRSRSMARVSILDPVGGAMQRTLLEREGVEFTDAGSIPLARFGWLPIDQRTTPRLPRDKPSAGSRRPRRGQ